MKKVLIITFLCILLTSCSSHQNPSELATPTVKLTNTSEPTKTSTPEPTSTPTATPTPIGGTSPLIAFYGQNDKGINFVFVGNMFDNEATPLIEISAEISNYQDYPIKWSPDGNKVLYFDKKENDPLTLFSYDLASGESSAIMEISENERIRDIFYSKDMTDVIVITSTTEYLKKNLGTGQVETIKTQAEYPLPLLEFGIQVDEQYPYMKNLYTNPEITTIYDYSSNTLSLKNPDESLTVIASFPESPFIMWGLFIDFSPDGKFGILSCLSDGFFYPIEMAKIPYTISEDEMLIHNYYYAKEDWIILTDLSIMRDIPPEIQAVKDDNFSIMMAWSPDSQYYIVENSLFTSKPSDEKYTIEKESWHFDVRNSMTNEVVFTYDCPDNVGPLVYASNSWYKYKGFDVVWPTK